MLLYWRGKLKAAYFLIVTLDLITRHTLFYRTLFIEIYTIVGQDKSYWVYWKIKALEFHIPPRENKGIFSWFHKMTAEIQVMLKMSLN